MKRINHREIRTWVNRIIISLSFLLVVAVFVKYDQRAKQYRLDTALIEAIKQNDIPTAIALLDRGANACAIDKPEVPITVRSILADLENLLQGKQSPKDRKYYLPCILLRPVLKMQNYSVSDDYAWNDPKARDNPNLVRALLDHGSDPNAVDERGDTLLHHASEDGRVEIVKCLLEYRTHANGSGIKRRASAVRDNNGHLRLNIDPRTQVDVKNHEGLTPLMMAGDIKVFQALIDHKAEVNIQDNRGLTALMRECKWPGDVKKIRILLNNGAKVSIKDHSGLKAWDYAYISRYREIGDLLIEAEKTEQFAH